MVKEMAEEADEERSSSSSLLLCCCCCCCPCCCWLPLLQSMSWSSSLSFQDRADGVGEELADRFFFVLLLLLLMRCWWWWWWRWWCGWWWWWGWWWLRRWSNSWRCCCSCCCISLASLQAAGRRSAAWASCGRCCCTASSSVSGSNTSCLMPLLAFRNVPAIQLWGELGSQWEIENQRLHKGVLLISLASFNLDVQLWNVCVGFLGSILSSIISSSNNNNSRTELTATGLLCFEIYNHFRVNQLKPISGRFCYFYFFLGNRFSSRVWNIASTTAWIGSTHTHTHGLSQYFGRQFLCLANCISSNISCNIRFLSVYIIIH